MDVDSTITPTTHKLDQIIIHIFEKLPELAKDSVLTLSDILKSNIIEKGNKDFEEN